MIMILATVYLPLIAAMYFGWYENLMCFLSGARPLKTRKEKNYLLPMFNEIYALVQYDMRLYIVNDFSINAFAVGARTVAVTKGAINSLSKEQLKGLMAHEVGHLYYAHPTGTILGMFGNGIFSLAVIVFKLLTWLFKNIPNYADDNEAYEVKDGFIVKTCTGFFNFVVFLINGIPLIVNSARSRKNERYADYYAAHIGYGNQLLSASYALDDITPEGFINVKQHVTRSHSYLYDRIAMLEKGMN